MENRARGRFWVMILAIILTALILVVFNILLKGTSILRKDFTEDQRYSLSEATKKILRELPAELHATTYISKSIPPTLLHVPETLTWIFQQYRALSQNRFSYEFKDPADDVDTQAEVERLGLKPRLIGDVKGGSQIEQKSCYCAMVWRYGDKTVPFDLFTELPDRIVQPAQLQGTLEYEFATLIKKITGDKKVIGIVSEKIQSQPQPGQQAKSTDYMDSFRTMLAKSYEVQDVAGLNFGNKVPDAVTTLIVQRPKKMAEPAKYEIDQFIMRGGNVMFFVDQSEIDLGKGGKQPQTVKGTATEPGLADMLESYGVRILPGVVHDRTNHPFFVPQADPSGQRLLGFERKDYPSWVRVPKEQLNAEVTISSTVQGLSFFWASPLEVVHENLRKAGTRAEILASSSNESWVIEDLNAEFNPKSPALAEAKDWKSYPLAVLLSGKFQSFYKGKEVPKPVGADGKELPNAPDPGKTTVEICAHDSQILVVGDSDCLDDMTFQWLMAQYGRINPFANAGRDHAIQDLAFAINAADSFTLGMDVAQIRSRQIQSRVIDKTKVTAGTELLVKIVAIGLLPAAVLVLGILRWTARWVGTKVPAPPRIAGSPPTRTVEASS